MRAKLHHLQHRLQVIGDLEGSLGLSLDLLDGNTVGDLNEGQTVGEVNVEDAEVSDDAADAGGAGQGELAVLDDLGVALLVGVFHGHDDLGGGRVGDQIHGTTEALYLTREHP
jgi:hypothetical protein